MTRPGICFCGTATDGMYRVICFDVDFESLILTHHCERDVIGIPVKDIMSLNSLGREKNDTTKCYRNKCKIKCWVFLSFL